MERRELYRLGGSEAAAGLRVEIEVTPGQRIEAEIVDLSRKGVSLRLPAEGAPRLEGQTKLWLHLSDASQIPIAPIEAEVRSIIQTPGRTRIGLCFSATQNLAALLPGHLVPRFNRRSARRVRPATQIAVELWNAGGQAASGEIRDLSWSGLGVVVDATSPGCQLDHHTLVQTLFALPGARRTFRISGRILRDLLIDEVVFYGIRFEPGADEDFEAQQAELKRYLARCFVEEKRTGCAKPDPVR